MKKRMLALLMAAVILSCVGCEKQKTEQQSAKAEASVTPTMEPTETPKATEVPTEQPTIEPTVEPTEEPELTGKPVTPEPTQKPAIEPTDAPTVTPEATDRPTSTPKPTVTVRPTVKPTSAPKPTAKPTVKPTATPKPTAKPTVKPTITPKPTEPPAHTHDWKPYFKKVTHEATGHYEDKVIWEAYDEPVYEMRTICNKCGEDITGNAVDHSVLCGGGYSTQPVQVGTIHHDEVIESVWVEDTPAWTESVIAGYKCDCGEKKEK